MKATIKTKVGRPPLKQTEKRMYTYAVRLTEFENKHLQKITKSYNTTASEIIRQSIFKSYPI